MKKYHEKDTDLVSFLDSMFIEKGLSKNTVSSYKSDILDAFNWSMLNHKVSLKKIKNYEIEAYIKYLFDKNYKSTTVNRKISSLKAFFLFLLKKGRISENPLSDLPSPRQEKRVQFPLDCTCAQRSCIFCYLHVVYSHSSSRLSI